MFRKTAKFESNSHLSLKSEKDWPVDFAKLSIRESDSVYNRVC